MRILTVFFLCIAFSQFSEGQNCMTLVGTWYDEELGSRLMLDESPDGMLMGNYTLADNSRIFDVTGMAALSEPSAVFSFRIISNDGAFVKSWIGQCLVCNNKENLITTWLLRLSVSGCLPNWHSTNVGKSVLVRDKPAGGSDCYVGKEIPINYTDPDMSVCPTPPSGNVCSSLAGQWFNELGSDTNLTVNGMNIYGKYRTAVESKPGASGGGHSDVYGVAALNGQNNALAMNVIWSNGTSMTLWSGQCHLCGGNETLLTSWILWATVGTCLDTWMSPRYGQDVFTRYPQIPVSNQQVDTTPEHSEQGSTTQTSSANLVMCYQKYTYIVLLSLCIRELFEI